MSKPLKALAVAITAISFAGCSSPPPPQGKPARIVIPEYCQVTPSPCDVATPTPTPSPKHTGGDGHE